MCCLQPKEHDKKDYSDTWNESFDVVHKRDLQTMWNRIIGTRHGPAVLKEFKILTILKKITVYC